MKTSIPLVVCTPTWVLTGWQTLSVIQCSLVNLFLKIVRYPTVLVRYLPQGILTVSLLIVYLMTIAPGLTWANHGSDGGDLITASVTGGVAHPTGYPVYLLLSRFFQFFPFGSLAFRTNLMSAIAAVAAVLVVYELVSRYQTSLRWKRDWLAGLVSAYAFGLSPLFWSQAVITEVNTLHALFVALILYLSFEKSPLDFAQKRSDRFVGFLFGLAWGNHMTTILLLPALLPSTFFHKPLLADGFHITKERQAGLYSILHRLVWLGIGLLSYFTLPLRALSQPLVNWGDPVTLKRFGWLVSGELYQDQLFHLTLASIWLRIQAVARLLIEQFGVLGLIVGLFGLIVFYKSSYLYVNTLWIFFVFFFFAIMYATPDSFMYLIPSFLCFSIWIGLGVGRLMDLFIWRTYKIGMAISLLFILQLFFMAGNHWRQVDASQDVSAERFGAEVLARAPRNAIVFAEGDKAIFAMWYFHYALKERSDLVVVATDLLSFDWYQKTLQINYPDLEFSSPFLFAENMAEANPDRPVCYIHYDIKSEINCSERE